MSTSFNPPNTLGNFQKPALIAGGVFLLALLALLFINPARFFQAYLVGWTFWAG